MPRAVIVALVVAFTLGAAFWVALFVWPLQVIAVYAAIIAALVAILRYREWRDWPRARTRRRR